MQVMSNLYLAARSWWTCAGVLHSCASVNVLLFYRNHFMDAYCHMWIAALEFVTQVKEIVLRTLYAHACREIRVANDTWLSTQGDQRSLDPSVDSESFVLYLEPHVALRRLSIKQSLGQDVPWSSGECGGRSGAKLLSSFLTCNY